MRDVRKSCSGDLRVIPILEFVGYAKEIVVKQRPPLPTSRPPSAVLFLQASLGRHWILIFTILPAKGWAMTTKTFGSRPWHSFVLLLLLILSTPFRLQQLKAHRPG